MSARRAAVTRPRTGIGTARSRDNRGDPAGPGVADGATGRLPRGRRRLAFAATMALVAGAAAGVLVTGGSRRAAEGAGGGSPVSVGVVTRGTLTARTAVGATLGYAGNYSAINQTQGTYTSLPAPGQVITQGQVLYRVDGSPVVLLYGQVPAYRSLSPGMTGADVQDLNADLVALGYATAAQLDPSSDYFSTQTADAMAALQSHLAVTPTGSLTLGAAIFLPAALRVATTTAVLGAPAAPGTPALTGTSTTPQVTIALDAALQGQVRPGDNVTITLPDQRTTPGVVTSVGDVASAAPGGAGSGGSGLTVTVDVALSQPAAAGGLDQAPVQVTITTASVSHALAVPVTALLATTSGYQVQVAARGGRYRFVPVSLGLFDDAAGLVQVTAPGLQPGQKVIEAQS
jgi:Putative peptidoglycan binding domain